MHVWLMELLCEASKKPLALSAEQNQKQSERRTFGDGMVHVTPSVSRTVYWRWPSSSHYADSSIKHIELPPATEA